MAQKIVFFVFLLILIVGIGVSLSLINGNPPGMIEVGVEPFSPAPSRVRDCNCLPGYLPSRKDSKSTFFCKKVADPKQTRPCY